MQEGLGLGRIVGGGLGLPRNTVGVSVDGCAVGLSVGLAVVGAKEGLFEGDAVGLKEGALVVGV